MTRRPTQIIPWWGWPRRWPLTLPQTFIIGVLEFLENNLLFSSLFVRTLSLSLPLSLGDKGFQAVTNYFSGTQDEKTNPSGRLPPGRTGDTGEPRGSAPSSETGGEGAGGGHGTLMIRDVTSRSAIAHFQAHTSGISAMAFSPNGSLLVTASSQGHELCVFQILPNVTGDPGKPSFNLLYRLKRGTYTNAIIEDISFNSSSQWVAVSSARGTTRKLASSPRKTIKEMEIQ